MDSDVSGSIFDENLLPIFAKYSGWTMPFSAICTFEVNMVSCNVFYLILCARALLIFSEFSSAMNASLTLCIAFKLLQIISLEGVEVSTGALLRFIDGS